MKGYLFVGGPADGERIAVRDDVSLEIPMFESLCDVADIDLASTARFSKIRYIKYRLSKNYSVHAPVDFTHDQIIKKLIENYCVILPE